MEKNPCPDYGMPQSKNNILRHRRKQHGYKKDESEIEVLSSSVVMNPPGGLKKTNNRQLLKNVQMGTAGTADEDVGDKDMGDKDVDDKDVEAKTESVLVGPFICTICNKSYKA
jgi:hypothetical protein